MTPPLMLPPLMLPHPMLASHIFAQPMLPLAAWFEVNTSSGNGCRAADISRGCLACSFRAGSWMPLPEDVPLIAAGILIFHHRWMHLWR